MLRMRHWPTLLGVALVLILLVSACGATPTASPAAAPAPAPTATSAPALTMAPAATATTAPAATATTAANPAPAPNTQAPGLAVAHDAKLGDILTDAKGMTLYIYTKDTPGTSVCYNGCATAWPPFLVSAGALPTAPAGFTGAFATTTRTDGTMQLTYNGMPLYYYVKDKNPGDVTGQGVGSVWYVIATTGVVGMTSPTAAATVVATAAATPAAAAAASAGLAAAHNATLGDILTDDKGMTLYLYTKDTPGTSVCYNGCATAWPPFLVTGSALPAAPTGFTGAFSTTKRTDGTTQLTYNGMPLYYYAKDKAPGDTTGQGVGSVWYIINPNTGAGNNNSGGYSGG